MKTKFSLFYSFFKTWNRFGIISFYRKRQVVNYEQSMPDNVPLVMCANHQNALIDALNMVNSTRRNRQPSFMTRADIFGGFWDIILYRFKMLPIYRQRDGFDTIKKNEEIFQICRDRLAKNESIIIFPEASHFRDYNLRPLKKGFARIAFQAEIDNGYSLGVQVIPLGLNYSNHVKFRSDILVVYGKPIPVEKYYELHQEKPNKALIAIRKELQQELKKCMIHVAPGDNYETVEEIRRIVQEHMVAQMGTKQQGLYGKFLADKASIAAVESQLATQPEEKVNTLREQVRSYKQGLKDLRLRDHIFAKAPYNLGMLLIQVLPLLIGLPLHLYGVLHNYLPYKLSERLTLKNWDDNHFHSSYMMTIGMGLFPIWYLLLWIIGWVVSGSFLWGLAYLISLPVSGNFAMFYSVQVKKWVSRWRYARMKAQKNTRLEEVAGYRQSIWDTVLPWLEPVARPVPEKS